MFNDDYDMTDSLYHYQTFSVERLRPILETRTVYFSNPKDFNDPWDCRPVYDTQQLRDTRVRDAHIKFFLKSHQKHIGGRNRHQRRGIGSRLRTEHELLEVLVEKAAGIEEDIFRRYRVYCLSRRGDCILMWAHYARNHTGICLEFDVKCPLISAAVPVNYRDRYPSLDLTSKDDALLALTTKSKAWAYEQEARLIAQERSTATRVGKTLLTDRNFLEIPAGALKSVILGCTMAEADCREAIQIAEKTGVAVKRARRIPNRYELAIEPVSTNLARVR
jgi:hypothetical protein